MHTSAVDIDVAAIGAEKWLRKIAQAPRSRSTPILCYPGKPPQITANAAAEVCKIGPPSVCNLRPALTSPMTAGVVAFRSNREFGRVGRLGGDKGRTQNSRGQYSE
jgi:hypothetical protein